MRIDLEEFQRMCHEQNIHVTKAEALVLYRTCLREQSEEDKAKYVAKPTEGSDTTRRGLQRYIDYRTFSKVFAEHV